MNLFTRTNNNWPVDDDIYITIAGIKRSGTTWQANIVRCLCKLEGKEVWMGEDRKGEPQDEVTINKLHPFNMDVAHQSDLIFTSFRPLDEIVESWRRFRGQYPSYHKTSKWVEWLAKWNLYADFMMEFNVLRDPMSKVETIHHIAAMLPFDFGELSMADISFTVLDMMDNIQPPEDKFYDEETCLFHNHITSEEFKQ